MAYRGKYPERINTVFSDRNASDLPGLCVVTNDGKRFRIVPRTMEARARAPQVGQDIARFILMPDHYYVHARD